MYIWTGCKLPEDFAHALRHRCLQANEALGLDVSGFSLPQHISLKQSFDTNADVDTIMDTFLLGVSETGKSGSYRVVRTLKV